MNNDFNKQDDIFIFFKTKDPRLCFQYIENYIHDIEQQLDRCNNALIEQEPSCPSSLSCDTVDRRLKEYIQSQQKQFRQKLDHQLSNFKNFIHEKELYATLFQSKLTHARVESCS